MWWRVETHRGLTRDIEFAVPTSKRLADENGFTLPELLLSAVLLLGLLAVMGASLTVIGGTQPRIAERSYQVQAGRAMIERLTRELREGSGLQATTASSLNFRTFVRAQQCGGSQPPASPTTPAIECSVTYTCTAGQCSRTEAPPTAPGSGTTKRLLEGLRTTEIFSYTPTISPTHVTVTLEYPREGGEESVTLTDGAALRNVGA